MAVKRSTPLVPPGHVRDRYIDVLEPGEAAALELLFTAREAAHRLDAMVAGWLGPDALTPGRLQVLIVLWSRDGAVAQREIVKALKVSRANVSALVDVLHKEGHVTSGPGPIDKRQVLVALTPSGRAVTDRLVRETAAKLRASLALDDGDLRLLAGLMARMFA